MPPQQNLWAIHGINSTAQQSLMISLQELFSFYYGSLGASSRSPRPDSATSYEHTKYLHCSPQPAPILYTKPTTNHPNSSLGQISNLFLGRSLNASSRVQRVSTTTLLRTLSLRDSSPAVHHLCGGENTVFLAPSTLLQEPSLMKLVALATAAVAVLVA